MTWKPSAYLNLRENERKIGSNLIGSGTSKELVTEVSLMLGGTLVLDPIEISTTEHTSRRTSVRYCNTE